MESYNVSKPNESGFRIDGFPDAVKVIAISGEKAREAADLTSHRSDLNFAAESAEEARQLFDGRALVRQALWRCAVFHYFKCFATGARSPLSKHAIYDNDAMAMEMFEYFLDLRNKHLAHDVNAYVQCIPGAVLNSRDAPAKRAMRAAGHSKMDTSLLYTLADEKRQEEAICRIQERVLGPTGLLTGSENQQPTAMVAHQNGPQKAKVISSDENEEFATAFIFNLLDGGPVATRTPDLYRVKVAL